MTFNFFLLTFSARSTHLIFLFFRWQNVRQGPRGDFAGERREAEPAVGDRAAVSGSERLSLHSASPQRCFNSASLARILPQRTATALWCHLSQCLRPRDSCSNRREWRTSSARKKLHQTVERFCKVRRLILPCAQRRPKRSQRVPRPAAATGVHHRIAGKQELNVLFDAEPLICLRFDLFDFHFFSPTFPSVISLNIQTRGSLFVRRKSPDCWSKPVKSMPSCLCVQWRSRSSFYPQRFLYRQVDEWSQTHV